MDFSRDQFAKDFKALDATNTPEAIRNKIDEDVDNEGQRGPCPKKFVIVGGRKVPVGEVNQGERKSGEWRVNSAGEIEWVEV